MRRLAGFALALTIGALPCAHAEPLRIGLSAPLSGADAVFGMQLRLGVERAVADINASGGFLGQTAAVVAADDGGDPKKGVDVAKGFTSRGVNYVIGPFSSAVATPASTVYADGRVLEITPSAMSPQLTDRGLGTLFRTCGREDQQAGTAVEFLLRRHYDKIAILHDRTTTGKALADSVRDGLASAGVPDAFYGSFAQETHDVSPLVARMRATGAKIVVWGGSPAGAALLVRQLRESKANIPLLGGIGLASDDFASLAGPAADGTFMVFPQDPRRRPSAAGLVRRLQEESIDAYGYVFYAYAAVQVIQQAAERAHSLQPAAVAAALHGGRTFHSVLGDLAFDQNGDPKTSDLTVFVWHRGASGRMGFSDLAGS